MKALPIEAALLLLFCHQLIFDTHLTDCPLSRMLATSADATSASICPYPQSQHPKLADVGFVVKIVAKTLAKILAKILAIIRRLRMLRQLARLNIRPLTDSLMESLCIGHQSLSTKEVDTAGGRRTHTSRYT